MNDAKMSICMLMVLILDNFPRSIFHLLSKQEEYQKAHSCFPYDCETLAFLYPMGISGKNP